MGDAALVLMGVMLILGLLFAGCGSAIALTMRMVPTPGDGLVQVMADFFSINVGLSKNMENIKNDYR